MNRITVLLAEDHQIVREGFRALLKDEPDIEMVGEAENGRQAIQLIRKLRPQVVVIDIAMPLLNGFATTRQIREDFPETKVLILSAHNDDAYVEQMTMLGASGFLLKQASAHVLPQAIRDVYQGKKVFTPSVAKRLQNRRKLALDRGGKGKNSLDVAGLTRYAIAEGIIESTVRLTIV
ncbi:MAG: LuxR family transcriptional regulator [Verrucomicrobia bacterium]|nr:LuxR family transcriptional regulator [Verrucomicrobiota bacterium]